MQNVYAQVGSSFQQVGGDCPDGFIEMVSQRPEGNYIAAEDGAWIPDPKYTPEAKARDIRNTLLTELDGIVTNPLRWSSLKVNQQVEVSGYRLALLDVPQQVGFPNSINWPAKPNFL